MKTETRVALLWPGLLMFCIFLVSGASRIATPDLGIEFSKDKLAHFLVFGLLATSFFRLPALRAMGLRGAGLAILLTVSFGGLDEFRQSFTPGRSVEFADWIADAAGAVVASLVYHYWAGYRNLLEMKLRLRRDRDGS